MITEISTIITVGLDNPPIMKSKSTALCAYHCNVNGVYKDSNTSKMMMLAYQWLGGS